MTEQEIIALHKKYARSDKQFQRCWQHCMIVAELAEEIANNFEGDVDQVLLRKASLLHDIGAYVFADDDFMPDEKYYHLHGIVGSKILNDEGFNENICSILESHNVAGSPKDIVRQLGVLMPDREYETRSIEAEIIKFADRFHNKLPAFQSFASLDKSTAKRSELLHQWFMSCADKFGKPDIDSMAKKYNQRII